MQTDKDVCINNFSSDDDLYSSADRTHQYGEDFLNVRLLGRHINDILISNKDEFVVVKMQISTWEWLFVGTFKKELLLEIMTLTNGPLTHWFESFLTDGVSYYHLACLTCVQP